MHITHSHIAKASVGKETADLCASEVFVGVTRARIRMHNIVEEPRGTLASLECVQHKPGSGLERAVCFQNGQLPGMRTQKLRAIANENTI
jgi:hypothetical protein